MKLFASGNGVVLVYKKEVEAGPAGPKKLKKAAVAGPFWGFWALVWVHVVKAYRIVGSNNMSACTELTTKGSLAQQV